MTATLPDFILEPLVRTALTEDLSPMGDVTTRAVIAPGTRYTARLNAREQGVVSGMQIAAIAFRLVDPALKIETLVADGQPCTPGQTLMVIEGEAASILMGERVALNFAGRLTGIATLTAAFVAQTKGTKTRITCTRKTTPGLRVVEKLAVAHGGGSNHRFGLSDAILIKDNHVAAAGGIRAVLEAAKAVRSHMMRIELEVDSLSQLQEALAVGGADVILLDNMDTPTLRAAVELTAGRVVLEASGNMKLDRIAEVAATGVDYISDPFGPDAGSGPGFLGRKQPALCHRLQDHRAAFCGRMHPVRHQQFRRQCATFGKQIVLRVVDGDAGRLQLPRHDPADRIVIRAVEGGRRRHDHQFRIARQTPGRADVARAIKRDIILGEPGRGDQPAVHRFARLEYVVIVPAKGRHQSAQMEPQRRNHRNPHAEHIRDPQLFAQRAHLLHTRTHTARFEPVGAVAELQIVPLRAGEMQRLGPDAQKIGAFFQRDRMAVTQYQQLRRH
jgi:nicotinate-nucleotide pyrophosphorylase (carboxylating)